jgi:hypothetical protein
LDGKACFTAAATGAIRQTASAVEAERKDQDFFALFGLKADFAGTWCRFVTEVLAS